MIFKHSLKYKNPELSAQWHSSYNGKLMPEDVTPGSNKKVWWKCNRGHEWQTTVKSRSRGSGYPYCSGNKVLLGKTDLATVNPKVASEWHPSKNNELTARMVTAGSNKKVWWLCSEAHEWEATVCDRNGGYGCPYCSGKRAIPGKTDLHTTNPILAQEWNYIKNDNLLPSEVKANSGQKVWWQCPEGHEWKSRIADRNRGDGCPYCSGRLPILGETDLAFVSPELAKEWHPTKNEGLNPTMITASSGKKVWWQCQHGHEWESSIANRNEHGCPYCSGKLPIVGETDLAAAIPTLASEWHPFKNGNLKPNMVTVASGKKVWWQCSQGHEWQATIANRNYGEGCPYCSGRKAILNETDLETINPNLAKQWHPSKNGELKPVMVTEGSNKKVWWKCPEGHEWQAVIEDRYIGKGCPYCSGKIAILGKTDLATVNSKLASEWHPSKNGELKPAMVTAGSNKNVWWKCSEGHEWQAMILARNRGNGCPYCSGKLAIPGKTDLTTLNSRLASEWHPSKNGELMPTMVTAGSSKKVWWQCSKGHEWRATVAARHKGSGCPLCIGRKSPTKKNIS